MFGRKFLQLKKKIYSYNADNDNMPNNEVTKLIENDDSSFSFQNFLTSKSAILSSQNHNLPSFSFRKFSQKSNDASQNATPKPIVDLNKVFENNYNCNYNYYEKFTLFENEIDRNFSYQTLSKFKNNFNSDAGSSHCVQPQLQIQLQTINKEDDEMNIKNENKSEFIKHSNTKMINNSIFYSDRFFIYPFNNINKNYFQSKYNNLTNRQIKRESLQFNCSETITKYTNLFIDHLHSFGLVSESKEKFEKLILNYQNIIDKMNQEISRSNDELEFIMIESANIENKKEKVLQSLFYGELHRKKLHEYIHSIKGNIRVYCRVKPGSIENSILNYPEVSSNVNPDEIYSIEIKNPKTNENTIFNYDKVFTEKSEQEEIFSEVKNFIQSALDGENVCIFAYGSTGSGKTHTMQGSYSKHGAGKGIINEGSGILPRCADFIFEETSRLNILGQQFKIFFSAIEIYNENLYDLLDKSSKKVSQRQPLTIYMVNNEIQIKSLNWVSINNQEDILKYTKEASETRRSDSTQFNSTSSRSHAIFQIKIECQNEDNIVSTSVINIIDLAGSERSSLTSHSGKTKEELEIAKKIQNDANFINKSLTTLGRIISMIGDKKSAKIAIPYRESKLTMVLQNSLKANSKTVMIVTVCSDLQNYGLTKESLKFATNAMMSC